MLALLIVKYLQVTVGFPNQYMYAHVYVQVVQLYRKINKIINSHTFSKINLKLKYLQKNIDTKNIDTRYICT